MSVNVKGIILVFAVFVGGLGLGIELNQMLSRSSSAGTLDEEKLDITTAGVWYDNLNGAAAVTIAFNSGKTDLTLIRVVVGGILCDWADIYYWVTDYGPPVTIAQPTGMESASSSIQLVVDGFNRTFQQASNNINLLTHLAIVLVLRNPGNLTYSTNIPDQIMLSLFTQRDLYYKEMGVEKTFYFMSTEQVKITNVQFTGTGNGQVVVTVQNTGTSPVTMTEMHINNDADLLSTDVTLVANSGAQTITLTFTWTAGFQYEIEARTAKGNQFTYTATAPS
jgi:hypothetical protein